MRYQVGCAGMFVLGTNYGMDDEDEAIVACESGPAGCEVLDTETGKWVGPSCWEDIEDAKARIAARVNPSSQRLQSQPPVLDPAQSASSRPMGSAAQTPAAVVSPGGGGRRDPSTSR